MTGRASRPVLDRLEQADRRGDHPFGSDKGVESQTGLSPEHRAVLEESGIAAAVSEARGYFTATSAAELERLGFGRPQRQHPTLVIPLWSVRGEIQGYQHRPDRPRQRKGKVVKYETPAGASMMLDVHPATRPMLADPSIPLFITEGVKKADSATSRGLCCLALLGVWNWRGTNEQGGKTALSDWEDIALNDRRVIIAFDSDVVTKREVTAAMRRLKTFLEGRGADVGIAYLPSGESGRKVGLDDFFAAGNTVDDLMDRVVDEVIEPERDRLNNGPFTIARDSYEMSRHGILWCTERHGGESVVPLTNFGAVLQRELRVDDGSGEARVVYELRASEPGSDREVTFRVSQAEFRAMNWPATHVGHRALLEPGLGVRERVEYAIRFLSQEITEESRIYAHTGWLRRGDRWLFLHGGGAIDEDGADESIETMLPASLDGFRLEVPEDDDELAGALQQALCLLEVAGDQVGFVLLGAVFRAVLGGNDTSVFLEGPTGVMKTSLAAIAQAFFGRSFSTEHVPASWSSTDNAIEDLLFVGKDVLVLVDDFVPGDENPHRAYSKLNRVLRAQGNRSGRGRLRADGTARPVRPPRGLVLCTGEERPRQHSVLARTVTVSVGRDDVDLARLTGMQKAAKEGVLVRVLTRFIMWVAPFANGLSENVRSQVEELRNALADGAGHRRTPAAVSQIGVGARWFLRFTQQVGAIDEDQRRALEARLEVTLRRIVAEQGEVLRTAAPLVRFFELLQSALATGEAHLVPVRGSNSQGTERLGWRSDRRDGQWEPRGQAIGWTCDGAVFLDRHAACAVAKRVAAAAGDPLIVGPLALGKILAEGGKLRTETRGGKVRHQVRRTLDGRLRQVWEVPASSILSDDAPTADPPPASAVPSASQVSKVSTTAEPAGWPAGSSGEPGGPGPSKGVDTSPDSVATSGHTPQLPGVHPAAAGAGPERRGFGQVDTLDTAPGQESAKEEGEVELW